MNSQQTGFMATFAMGVVMLLSGCQASNMYYAADLPMRFRAAPQVNAKRADLGRLTSVSGGGDTIVAGDVLEIAIATGLRVEDQVPYKARVGSDGSIQLPNVAKRLQVSGLEPQAAEALIAQETINSGQFRNPVVTITFLHRKMNRVRVLGGVKEPQLYELRPGSSDVVSAIAAAGGLSDKAGANVTVRNPAMFNRARTLGSPIDPYATVSGNSVEPGQPSEQTINLVSATQSGINTYNVHDGAVVMVEEQDPEPIQVLGLVKDSGAFDFPIGKDLTVLKAIAMADGVSNQLADRVYVIRQKGGQRVVIDCSIRHAKRDPVEDVLLQPGDIVSVEQTPATVMMEALQLIRFGISGSTALF